MSQPDYNPLVTITVWHDPAVQQHGYPTRSTYLETYWLPQIGPTAAWVLRRLARELQLSGSETMIDLTQVSAEMGLRLGPDDRGRSSIFQSSLQRLSRFHLIEQTSPQHWRVRLHVPPITARQVTRLPDRLRDLHRTYQETPFND